MKQIPWRKWASIVICLAGAIGSFVFFFKPLISLLLPFLLAWLLSLTVVPLSFRISKRTKIPVKVCSVVLFLAELSGIVFFCSICLSRAVSELQELANRLLTQQAGESAGGMGVDSLLGGRLLDLIPSGSALESFREEWNAMLSELLQNAVSSLLNKLPQVIGKLISSLPSVLLFIVVTVISGFYFCLDNQLPERGAVQLLPKPLREKLPVWKEKMRHLSLRYVKAYLLLLLITFGELFLGFSLLRVDYAFLLAILTAIVDLLPVLGVGTVLLPWSVFALLQRNFRLGIGLLILYLAVTVLRQVAEPKLLGQSLGLHPLLTLFSGYAGWRLMGVLGMALGPLLALLGKSIWNQFRADAREKPETVESPSSR